MTDSHITPKRLRQIIAEEIQRDALIGKVRENMKMIRRDALEIPVIISENRTVSFGTLLKYVDRKIISEAESKNFWASSVNHMTKELHHNAGEIYENLKHLVKDNTPVNRDTLKLLRKIADSGKD